MKNKYRNLWFHTLNTPKVEFYENNAPLKFEHRGVKVYKLNKHQFDYVFEGACITQRAGCKSQESAAKVIDEIFDGESVWLSEPVAKHLEQHGVKRIEFATN